MSGRTPYIAAIWNAGVADGSPTNIGCRRQPPRSITRRRNGIRPSVRASSSTPRESPSICTTSSRRRPAVGAHPRRARRIRRSTKRWSPSTRSSRGIGALYYPIRDEPGAERRRRRAPLRRAGGASGRPGARARRRLPARARRAHARARPLRRARAARVRRPRPRRDHLCARHRGAVPRLDVAGRRDQQPHDGRADRAPPRHRGAARALAAPLRRRRGARRPLPHRAARGLRRAGDPHAGAPGRRGVSHQRHEDVRDQRPRGQHLRAARRDRHGRAAAPPRDVMLHRREGRGRSHGGEVDRQARLQGRGHRRAAVRGLRLPRRQSRRRRRGPRLRPGHERARGRTHQHRGARGGGLVSRDGEPEERRHMLLAVRQVVEKSLVPVAAEHDREGRVPDEIVAELADLGVFAALVPPAHGGLGLDPATWTMVIEEVARVWAAPALLAVAQGGVAFALGIAGGDTARHLPALGRAETLAAVVPIAAALARRDGAACVLDGETAPIAHAARAGLLALTLADGAAWRLVPASLAGVTVAAAAPDLGVRGAPPAVVSLRGVRLPVLRPSSSAPRLLAVVDLGLGAVAVGLGQAAFEAALRYSQQRSTFGKAICQHQAVQLKLADMATRLTAARLLVGDAAARVAAADDGGAARRARRFAVDAAVAVTLESMRIHGGYGYTTEFPVERYYRDAAALLAAAPEDAPR